MKLGKRLAAMCAAAMMAVTGMVMTASAYQLGTWSLQYYPGAPTSVNHDYDEWQGGYSGTGKFYTACSEFDAISVDFVLLKRVDSGNYYTYSYVGSGSIDDEETKKLGNSCSSSFQYMVQATLNHSYNYASTAQGIYYSE